MLSLSTFFAVLALLSCSTHAAPLNERGTTTTTATVPGASSTEGEYVFPVQVNGVTKNVVFDTGSTKSWIRGSGGNGPAFNASYSDGSWVAGNLTTGDLTVGGITFHNLTYGLASTLSHNSTTDGLLGFSASATQYSSSYKSVLAGLIPQLQQPIMSVDLQESTVNSSNQLVLGSGEFAFGWIDSGRFPPSSSVVYHPTDPSNPSAWFINISSFGVPNDTSAVCGLDTGTTQISAPMSVAQGYWSQVSNAALQTDGSGNSYWTFPCNTVLPNLTMVIDNTKTVIPGKYLTFPNSGKSSATCTSRLHGTAGQCWVGQPFFHAQYVVYNYTSKTIGIAPKQ